MLAIDSNTIDLLHSVGKRVYDKEKHVCLRAEQLKRNRAEAADAKKTSERAEVARKKKVKLEAFFDPVRTLTQIVEKKCCDKNCLQVRLNMFFQISIFNVFLQYSLLCNFVFFYAALRFSKDGSLEEAQELEIARN